MKYDITFIHRFNSASKISFIFIFLAFIPFALTGQPKNAYRVPAKTKVSDLVPYSETHLFTEFQLGKIIMTDGTIVQALMNYSFLSEQMELISETNDTSFIKVDRRLKQFDFKHISFINDLELGLIEIINDNVYPKLGRKRYYLVVSVDRVKNIGYASSPNPTISAQTEVWSNKNPYLQDLESQSIQSNRLVEKKAELYFIDKNKRVYEAKRSVLFKIFPRNKREIRDYLKEEKLDFKKEEDMIKLMQYCHNM